MPRPRALLGPLLAGLAFAQPGHAWAVPPAASAAKPAPAPGPSATPPKAPTAPTAAAAADPKRGAVTRKIPEAPAPTDKAAKPAEKPGSLPEAKKPEPAAPAAKPGAKPSHQKGKAPHKPASTLPPGVTKPLPDAEARRQVASGPTADEIRAGKDDPELKTLRDAERVLFPRALPGIEPGWWWDVPRPSRSTGPDVASSGLPPSGPLAPPSVAPTADVDWIKRLTLPNLPVRWDERVIKYLKFYRDTSNGRAVARVWAKKSGRYVGALKSELSRSGLPTDLVWLSLIESGHNPTIASPVGAVGLWQFMPDAGRTYGLVIDRWVDERLDPERATEAAARYLGDLYRRFGNWELSMAAYNMGYGGLTRAIRKFSSNDFWELGRYEAGIPWETTLYVPKIVATAIMMNNKAAFGIADVAPEPPQSFDLVLVAPGTPLDAVARATGVSVDVIEGMNPQFLAGRTPPAAPGKRGTSFRVRVPTGKGSAASKLLAVQGPELDGLIPYTVRQGDTVESIAATSATSEAKVRSLNRVGSQETLAAGTILLVPEPERAVQQTSKPEEVVVVSRNVPAPAGSERVFYRVVSGDTLSEIASAFAVNRTELVAWNSIDESARLVPGMTLQLFVKSGVRVTPHCLRERDTRVLVAGTPPFFDYYEGQNGKKRIVVSVREGDTLAAIGRRYGMTIGWMERINRRSRSDRLEPGETVVVYTDRAAQAAPPSVAVAALAAPLEPPTEAGERASSVKLEGASPE
jgi:membrane-bound lytic murein transglycosylase D